MDTLLFVFTTDGPDREDGSVYYADYLLVQAPEADRPEVREVLAEAVGGTVNSWDEVVSTNGLTKPWVLHELLAGGWQATWATAEMVVHDGEE